MTTSEFLLEFFSEEIPAKMQIKAGANLKTLFTKALSEHRLSFDTIEVFYSPQRLGCVIKGLPQMQSDFADERKGPNRKAPAQALAGFLKSVNLSEDQCEWRDTGKGEYLFANLCQKGLPTADILSQIIIDIANNFPWPKSMRWGANRFRWVRPLHHILAIFDGKIIDGALDLDTVMGDKKTLTFTNQTHGHRFLSPETLTVSNYQDYVTQLKKHHVTVEPEARKAEIIAQITQICTANNLTLIEDDALLNEVTGLIEHPQAYLAKIDPSFMTLPPEVMQTSMRENQKYFSLQDKTGKFAPYFILIANHIPVDGGAEIIHGNEKVLSARLSDAAFFQEQDAKTAFTDYQEQLKSLTFHEKLGTLYEKTQRVKALLIGESALKVASHYKNDLVTGMVGEFPELQGIMGSYYATDAGFTDAEALAIHDQYSPSGPNDACPTSPLSIQLGIADRIDTLVGFFGIGIKPTGSKDPFALRRAALSLIRLCVENDHECDLGSLIDQAISAYKIDLAACKADLLAFIMQRFYIYLKDQNHPIDRLDCLFTNTENLSLTDICHKLKAFENVGEVSEISAAYKRLNNMLSAETKKSKLDLHTVDEQLLEASQEKALQKIIVDTTRLIQDNVKAKTFDKALQNLSPITPYVNHFLDDLHINVDDIKLKTNRYSLMQSALNLYQQVADFSKLN